MWFLLACAHEPVAESPAVALEAAAPGLPAAIARVFGDDAVDPIAAWLAEADPALVALLGRVDTSRPLLDTAGESSAIDLISARATLDGTVLRATVTGRGVADHGAWVRLDTRDGPAPDLVVGARAGRVVFRPVDGWVEGPSQAIPGVAELDGDTIRFEVDLGATGRVSTTGGGAAVAIVRADGSDDPGPAGPLRPDTSVDAALRVMGALLADEDAPDVGIDPDLSLAVALAWAPWLGWVKPEVQAEVLADAQARYAYGLQVDAFLELYGASWRLGALPAKGKLVWASPGAQAVSYGALAQSKAAFLLDHEQYRFAVPDVATLEALRDLAPLGDGVEETVSLLDTAVWDELRYRASDDGMAALCDARSLRHNLCSAWASEQARGFDLGRVSGTRIRVDQGVSAAHQVRVREAEGEFVGDCATATTLTVTAAQALGIAAVPLGYAGPSWAWPTHDLPLVLVGDRFWSPQRTPSSRWDADTTWVYLHVPALSATHGATLGTEPSGFARGPSVPAARMTYGALRRLVADGVPLDAVVGWAASGRGGAWPSLTPE